MWEFNKQVKSNEIWMLSDGVRCRYVCIQCVFQRGEDGGGGMNTTKKLTNTASPNLTRINSTANNFISPNTATWKTQTSHSVRFEITATLQIEFLFTALRRQTNITAIPQIPMSLSWKNNWSFKSNQITNSKIKCFLGWWTKTEAIDGSKYLSFKSVTNIDCINLLVVLVSLESLVNPFTLISSIQAHLWLLYQIFDLSVLIEFLYYYVSIRLLRMSKTFSPQTGPISSFCQRSIKRSAQKMNPGFKLLTSFLVCISFK